MQTIQVYYISLSGNTTSFLERLDRYLQKEFQESLNYINVKDLVKSGEPSTFKINDPYFAFLPAYLEGGNGLDTGDVEILTTPLRRLIAHKDNSKHCLGIIGSGNRNFNKQFCLTAHQYSEEFGFPVLDEFELRGTEEDIKRIAHSLNTRMIEWRYSSELVSYRRLPNMTATTILHALRHRHNTKSGTWGKMTNLSGELKFYELKEDGQVIAEHVFNCENQPPFVEPQAWHKITPLSEDLEFYIEFYCKKEDLLVKQSEYSPLGGARI